MATVIPELCIPPHRVSHPEKVGYFYKQFLYKGWGKGYPKLVGYPWQGRIQLLSGSHRWAAALRARMPIPVAVVPYEQVEEAWGNLELWQELMKKGDPTNDLPS